MEGKEILQNRFLDYSFALLYDEPNEQQFTVRVVVKSS